MDDIGTIRANVQRFLTRDLGVCHDSNPMQEVVEARKQVDVEREEKGKFFRGFWTLYVLAGIAIGFLWLVYHNQQEALKEATASHQLSMEQLQTQYEIQQANLIKIHQEEIQKLLFISANDIKAVQLQHQKDLAAKTSVYEADLVRIKTESQTRIAKARHRVSAIEAEAVTQKTETDKVIRGLIHKNEQFKVYYETPAHQRAADIIWPERVQQPAKTGSTDASPSGNG